MRRSGLPKGFKQIRHKEALKRVLITRAEAEVLVKKRTEELQADNARCQAALKEANNKVRHLNLAVEINNKKLKALGRQPSQQATITVVDKEHPYGLKTQDFYCQLCWDVGLPKRRHKESACDPDKCAVAVSKKKAARKDYDDAAEKGKKKRENKRKTRDASPSSKSNAEGDKVNDKTRKYPLKDYKK